MKLAIGLPVRDFLPGPAFHHHVAMVVEAVKLPGVEVVLLTPYDVCPHDAARQVVWDEAVKQRCDRLFFVDDDTTTPKGGITRLMKVMDERSPVAVSGLYLRRGFPYTCVWSKIEKDEWFQVEAREGLHEIDSSGLGCCLIDVAKVEATCEKPLFRMDQDAVKTVISDDAVFFRRIRAAKGLVLGDAHVQCGHIGRPEMITCVSAEALRNLYNVLNSA